MDQYTNLLVLQNLYRMQALGYCYVDPIKTTTLTPPSFYPTVAQNLDQLHHTIEKCHLCDLSKSRKQAMCGYGNRNADLFIIDFSVSEIQDNTQNYFAGRSGETLKKMLQNVLQITPDEVYFTHAIKCKPLLQQQPTQAHFQTCQAHLLMQLQFVQPKVIMVLGQEAFTTLTSQKENFEDIRGHVMNFHNYKMVALYHPQHLLRNPHLKKITLQDLKTIKSCL